SIPSCFTPLSVLQLVVCPRGRTNGARPYSLDIEDVESVFELEKGAFKPHYRKDTDVIQDNDKLFGTKFTIINSVILVFCLVLIKSCVQNR
ncbi:hypothetical protein CERSUDRAFT_119251, partial [Gelatoporia subvermispora B]